MGNPLAKLGTHLERWIARSCCQFAEADPVLPAAFLDTTAELQTEKHPAEDHLAGRLEKRSAEVPKRTGYSQCSVAGYPDVAAAKPSGLQSFVAPQCSAGRWPQECSGKLPELGDWRHRCWSDRSEVDQ